jgi:hypothetical protein
MFWDIKQWKGRYVCLGFQLINVVMDVSNQLNKFWMSYSNINQMQDYKTFPKWHTLIWSVKTVFKHQIMSFFAPTSPIFLLKTLECNFIIKKMNLIFFINATFFMKKNPKF